MAQKDPLLGVLTIFKQAQDFRDSSSLVSLGRLDSDIQWLAGQSGDFKMVMEKAE